MKQTIVLADGMNLVHKTAHSSYALMKTSDGKHSGAIYGTMSQLFSISRKLKEDFKIVVCWDSGSVPQNKPVKTWREALISETYKEGRERSEEVVNAIKQIPSIIEGLSILGIPQLYVKGLEADDLIGMAAWKLERRKNVKKVIILSSDKDFFQCITDKVQVYRVNKGSTEIYTAKKVLTEFGVPPKLFASYKALIGDKSDKYKGVPNVGPAKADKMVMCGVRPRNKIWEDHSEEVRKVWGSKLEKQWEAAHHCFKLAFIPRRPNYPLLPKEMQRAAKKELETMERMIDGISLTTKKASMKRWIEFCASWELSTFMGTRRQIFDLCYPK